MPDNYRPISLVCKALEKHIYELIFNHLTQHYPLSDCQSAFQAGSSTVSALVVTAHDWLQLMESGKDVCAVFLDYQKAFDNATSMRKLQDIGLHVSLLAWLCMTT